MGIVASTLGIGIDFTFEGKAYRLSPWTYELQALYERYLEHEVVEAVKRVAVDLSPEEGRALMKDMVKDIAHGVYTFGGEEVSRSLCSPKHITKLFHLMLLESDPTITYPLVKKMVQTDLADIMDKISLANADPTKDGKKN